MRSKMACRKRSDRDLSLPGLCHLGELFIPAIILYTLVVFVAGLSIITHDFLEILGGFTNIIVLITCTRNAVEHKSAWSLVLDKGAFGLPKICKLFHKSAWPRFLVSFGTISVYLVHMYLLGIDTICWRFKLFVELLL